MEIDLSNKRVLVTGGNSGIGAAIARGFAANRARVAINYLVDPDEARRMAVELSAHGAASLALKGDISSSEDVERIFSTLDDKWGGIDILINNAGVDGSYALGWEADVVYWDAVIDINLKGTYRCSRAALKRMIKQRSGVVLNVSSVHETIAWTGYSAYTASKAGISMLSKSLAQEAAPFGVRVLCIAPGAIRTPINRSVWQDETKYEDLLTKIPLGRIGEPQDIANMAVILASDVAAYITGTTIFIDGGMTDYPSFSHGG
ncbi:MULTISPECIES: glucose 1-dehydrogenase [unclassified Rhizobium]|jgi:glucose 1-dehydrogenase|uniref:glucose 1-dehydrogenase n=1 Tax=unclassified Rhizobium TaxID=2613769 RepID=UPI000646E993|nr:MULTISPECIES: glucose 1-dehydrogenase [unclassified Rhizobium]OCI97128.1 glucose dehydrogenase [Rhizobium sp. AC27/96]RKD50517.1 glucose 1-dehydrogenase/3-dehydrosphinganine reductase [Rhizobium sp. WW_1]TIX93380.1 glucose 1-dehydrogenase [Rhizobium sp. P44RR-XXIV]TXH82643.1 MAG: glucose 1-dehydrogenase [Rhizobium sp.]